MMRRSPQKVNQNSDEYISGFHEGRRVQKNQQSEEFEKLKVIALDLKVKLDTLQREYQSTRKIISELQPLQELSRLAGILNSKFLPEDSEVSSLVMEILKKGLLQLKVQTPL